MSSHQRLLKYHAVDLHHNFYSSMSYNTLKFNGLQHPQILRGQCNIAMFQLPKTRLFKSVRTIFFKKTGLKRPRKTSEAVKVSSFEVAEDACFSVGPLKAASFYEF